VLIRFGYDIEIACPQATPLVCMLCPRDERQADLQRLGEVTTWPRVAINRYRDRFGNTCLRMTAPSGLFRITQDAAIRDCGLVEPRFPLAQETAVGELPDSTLEYLLASRYCETDLLMQTAWNLFGHLPPGWTRAQGICDFVHQHIRFSYPSARPTRTAAEAYAEAQGVCRDFAHLMIAFCRCMNMPARYVNGYLGDIGIAFNPDPMDFAASVEVFLGGQWMTFDPRNNMPRVGRIKIAHGRDAADVPLIHSFGQHALNHFRVWCYDMADPPPNRPAEMAL
jgi:transglutaminase-like putative cysteine protease